MDFITIDFETANYDSNSAISVGLVRFVDDKPVDSVYSLIRPSKLYIKPEFTEIHGLTIEDVEDAPDFSDVWQNVIKPFIDEASKVSCKKPPLVAHNVPFDKNVLLSCLKHYELSWDNPNEWLDTLALSRKVWPGGCHKLTYLASRFGITYDAHNALADSLACGKILLLINRELNK